MCWFVSALQSEVHLKFQCLIVGFFLLWGPHSMTRVHLVTMHSLSVAPYHPNFLLWTCCQTKTADLPGETGCRGSRRSPDQQSDRGQHLRTSRYYSCITKLPWTNKTNVEKNPKNFLIFKYLINTVNKKCQAFWTLERK